MAGVAANEDAVVQGIFLRNALADMVDRVPVDRLPLDAVGAQDLVSHTLDPGLRSGRSQVLAIVIRRDLDVDAHTVVTLGDNHARTTGRADGAFELWSSACDPQIKN